MIYEYRSRDGRTLEIDGVPGEHPVGRRIRRKGIAYTRQLPTFGARVVFDIPVVSNGLPRNWPYAKDWEPGTGKPRFRSNQEQVEAAARAAHAGEPVEYGSYD